MPLIFELSNVLFEPDGTPIPDGTLVMIRGPVQIITTPPPPVDEVVEVVPANESVPTNNHPKPPEQLFEADNLADIPIVFSTGFEELDNDYVDFNIDDALQFQNKKN
ncbi:uncharacterized protein LOC129571797 [Sitodiplosis mosellana]|uniref:uncharacterized protein LOC129571797 n=1 Tax=Sitodiplosis mosellana TaxID=263140 RepID=UPI0024437887|nr:uncharacterized protein LOC129571797 [Sitodiplosis mosellana]